MQSQNSDAATQPAAMAPPQADSTVAYVLQTTTPPTPAPSLEGTFGPAVLAFLGVLATLITKWIFDERKRKLDEKRHLYLDVADALHEGATMFGSFGNINIPVPEISTQFNKIIARLSKPEMVAGDSLLRALANLKNFLGEEFGNFLAERLRAEKEMISVKTNAPILDQWRADIEWCLEQQRQLTIDGKYDDAVGERFRRLQEQFAFAQDQRQQVSIEDARSHTEIREISQKLAEMNASFSRRLIPLRVAALSLMRAELDFKFSTEDYRLLQEEMATKAANMMAKFSKKLNETFPSQPSEDDRPL